MQFDFLSKIRSTLEGLFGNKQQQATLAPVHVTRPTPPPQQPPTPQPTAAPGTGNAMQYLQSQIPQGTTPQQYFPAMQDPQFMQGIEQADKMRQGLAGLLLLQGFFESTLGRAGNGNNVFGALPPGGASFNSPAESLNYQTSPAVLGGGANPNMNILASHAPLTPQDVTSLYGSYNPNSPYLQQLLGALFPQGQGR